MALAGAAIEAGQEPLLRFRMAQGLTIDQLAEASGVAPGRIEGKENGQNGLSADEAVVLAAVLGVPPDLLQD